MTTAVSRYSMVGGGPAIYTWILTDEELSPYFATATSSRRYPCVLDGAHPTSTQMTPCEQRRTRSEGLGRGRSGARGMIRV